MDLVADPFTNLYHHQQPQGNTGDEQPLQESQRNNAQQFSQTRDKEGQYRRSQPSQHRPDQRLVGTELVHTKQGLAHAAVGKNVDHGIDREGSEDDAASLHWITVGSEKVVEEE